MRKQIAIIATIAILISPINAKIKPRFIDGSKIYTKVFLFFFPISKEYNSFFTVYGNNLLIDLKIQKDDLKTAPSNDSTIPQIVDSDLSFTLLDVPIGVTGEFKIPVSIRCNNKISQKKIDCKIITNEDIMVIQGKLSTLRIGEMTDNPYFKNRAIWFYPYYFDIRIQL